VVNFSARSVFGESPRQTTLALRRLDRRGVTPLVCEGKGGQVTAGVGLVRPFVFGARGPDGRLATGFSRGKYNFLREKILTGRVVR